MVGTFNDEYANIGILLAYLHSILGDLGVPPFTRPIKVFILGN